MPVRRGGRPPDGPTHIGDVNQACSGPIYLIGVFGVTAARNVPLNEALESFDLGARTADQIEQRRASYEGPWNRRNTVRAIANVAAFPLATTAAVLSEQTD